jgi:F5/8 type C domain
VSGQFISRRILLTVVAGAVILFLFAPRLPAPISEESPTPAPKQSAAPKPKPLLKSTPKSEAASSPKLAGVIFNIPQSQMTATATSQHGSHNASEAIDGNRGTMWHTDFTFFAQPTAPLPQSITLNLGGTYNVNALHYLPRQDWYLHGTILTYKIYVSTNGSNFTQIATGNWANDHSEKTAAFAPAKASYIRLEAVAGHLGFASAAEINVTAIR